MYSANSLTCVINKLNIMNGTQITGITDAMNYICSDMTNFMLSDVRSVNYYKVLFRNIFRWINRHTELIT